MTLKEKIQEDLKIAVKKREKLESSVLRMLSAAILNREKEKRYKLTKTEPELEEKELAEKSELTDEEVIEAISSEIKKRKEAISEFSTYGGPAAGREKEKIENFINKEKAEMEILKKYLPEQLSEEEITKLAKEVIAASKASLAPEEREKVGPKDMGKVMAGLMPQVKGKAEGATVSRIVKELLTPK